LEEFIVRQLGEIRAPLRYLNGITCGVSYYVKNKLKGELFGERTTSRGELFGERTTSRDELFTSPMMI
jgi:hypothetical protein